MDNNLFDDLVASIKEAGAIKRKEVKASRVTELELPDIKEVREKTGLSQNVIFALLRIIYNFSKHFFEDREGQTSIFLKDTNPYSGIYSIL